MNLERLCACGNTYLATSPYDYSCPDCWRHECYTAVRTIEWLGGITPPGAMVVERTPITNTWENVVAFLTGFYSERTWTGDGQLVPCLIQLYRKPWTPAVPLEWLTDGDNIITSHQAPGLYLEDPDEPGRAFPPGEDGWWWIDTEVAWVGDPDEITCNEPECCLARANVHHP